jgi:hypothetical protein
MTTEEAKKINDRLVRYQTLINRLQNLETCKTAIGEKGADVLLKYRTSKDYIAECLLTGITLPDVLVDFINAEITTCTQEIDEL